MTPDDDRHDHGEERQFESRGAVLLDDVTERAPVGDGRTEVATRDVGEIVAVLDEDRPVEPEIRLDLVDLFLRHSAAERRRDGIARRDSHEQEDERQQDEHHRDHERQTRERVLPERRAFRGGHDR